MDNEAIFILQYLFFLTDTFFFPIHKICRFYVRLWFGEKKLDLSEFLVGIKSFWIYFEEGDACLNGATCVNTVGGYRCDCPEGFEGQNCENPSLCDFLPGSPSMVTYGDANPILSHGNQATVGHESKAMVVSCVDGAWQPLTWSSLSIEDSMRTMQNCTDNVQKN